VTNNRLSARELATVLAALRCFQKSLVQGNDAALRALPHFTECEPLSADEIDALCEQLNCVDGQPCAGVPASNVEVGGSLVARSPRGDHFRHPGPALSGHGRYGTRVLESGEGLELLGCLPGRAGLVVPPRLGSGRRTSRIHGRSHAMIIYG